MTSFRRLSKVEVEGGPQKSASNTTLMGSKLWLNSQSLVSSGIRQLDDILGGGLILGSVFMVEEDELFGVYSQHILSYRYLVCSICS